jgi:hypothetical protein
METLHDAETRQLESFIKSRSKELDMDINSLRKKMGTTHESIENDSLKSKVTASDLNVIGVGFGKVEFNNDAFNENVTKIKGSMPTFLLDPAKTSIQPNTVKDHLVLFLAKIKLSKTLTLLQKLCSSFYFLINTVNVLSCFRNGRRKHEQTGTKRTTFTIGSSSSR